MGVGVNNDGDGVQIDENEEESDDCISTEEIRENDNNKYDKNDNNNDDDEEESNVEIHEKFSSSYHKKSTVLKLDRIKSPKNKDDFRFLRYPTIRIKTIKRALSLCGHTIVGGC
jgi:hypothetical protein